MRHFPQIAQDFAEAHIGHVAVVDQRCVAGGFGHHVAAEKCEFGFRVEAAQFVDKGCCVEVARGFAC